jgi:CHAT domain-containing protein
MFGRKRKKAEAQTRSQLEKASHHFEAGFFDAGLETAMQAFNVANEGLKPQNPWHIRSLFKIAEGYFLIDLYDEAFDFYQQAMNAIAREEDPLYIEGLRGLAAIYREMGDQNQEDMVLRGIVRIQLKAKGETHPDYGAALYELSDLYRRAGAATSELALAGFENVLALYQSLDPEAYQGRITDCQFGIGACLFQLERYAEAEPFFKQAYQAIKQISGENHPPLADILQNLATIRATANDPGQALAYLQQAEDIYDHQIRHIFSHHSTEKRRLFLEQMMSSVFRYISLAVQFFPRDRLMAAQLMNLIGKRKSLGLDSQLYQRNTFTGAAGAEVKEKWSQVEKLRSRVAQKALAGAEPGQELRDHQEQLMAWEITAQEIEQGLLSKKELASPAESIHSFSLAALQKALPPQSALIEFVRFHWFQYQNGAATGKGFQGPVHYLALLCNAGGELSFYNLGEATQIEKEISAFRAAITGIAENAERGIFVDTEESDPMTEAGEALFTSLIQPLMAALGSPTRLFLATDGELSRLPFEALPIEGEQLLIDRYQVSYLATARELIRPAPDTHTLPSAALVMAGPDYELALNQTKVSALQDQGDSENGKILRASGHHFPPLPGTVVEGQQVAKALDVQPLLGKEATKGNLLGCRSPLVLHLATHGFFLNKPNPEASRLGNAAQMQALRTGLALAGANTWLARKNLPEDAGDGILNSEEAAQLSLSGTEMVVLSACETGLGDVLAGEGVYGLSRAFSLAGARTRILSLWKVPDKQTQALMQHFYEYLREGKGRAQALHLAKLAIRKTHPAPYFWAAFVCQGEPGPIASLRQEQIESSEHFS